LSIEPVKLLEQAVSIVNKRLEREFEILDSEARSISPQLGDLTYISRDFTLRGGKRLRAFLVLIGYWSREWGLEIDDDVEFLMSLVEFLQSYLLVHDDIMDKDVIRRGGPTVHVWFKDRCLSSGLIGDCEHYGLSQAITIGDLLESMAVNMFSKMDKPSNVLLDLIKTYTRGLRMVAYGQYLDLLLSYKSIRDVKEEDVLLVHMLKTSSYTVELPLHLGAILSTNYTVELLDELSQYAIPAGIAFQLKDDILGLFGKPEVTGKPAGSDVRERKKTLLIIHAYNNGSEDDRRFIEKIYDDPGYNVSSDDISRIQDIVVKNGGLEYVEKIMWSHVEKAKSVLSKSILINSNAKKTLDWLLEFFVKREK